MASKEKRRYVTVRLEAWDRVEVPEAAMLLARSRVQYLRGHALRESLEYLLASAYLQGINDCVAAHIRNPELVTAA